MSYPYNSQPPKNIAKNGDLEKGVEAIQSNPNYNQDPVMREMATAIIEECQHAKTKREIKFAGNVIGGIALVILFVVILIARSGTSNSHSRH